MTACAPQRFRPYPVPVAAAIGGLSPPVPEGKPALARPARRFLIRPDRGAPCPTRHPRTANTILAREGTEAYHSFTHGGGFFRSFFATLKGGTESSSVQRLLITGVSPVTIDDVTSGFNIGRNLSLRAELDDLHGFTETEVRGVLRSQVSQARGRRRSAGRGGGSGGVGPATPLPGGRAAGAEIPLGAIHGLGAGVPGMGAGASRGGAFRSIPWSGSPGDGPDVTARIGAKPAALAGGPSSPVPGPGRAGRSS